MGVLSSLPKPAQKLLLRPETASFLAKISSDTGEVRSESAEIKHVLHERPYFMIR